MSAPKVCAVIVTFNRRKCLLECLQALQRQTTDIAAIYIADNASTDGTPQALLMHGYLDRLPPCQIKEDWLNTISYSGKPTLKIHYHRLTENIGGAGGFAYGVAGAHRQGYDWLWLMDDDGLPENDALENLLSKGLKQIVLCSVVVEKDNPERLCFGLRIGRRAYYQRHQLARFADHRQVLAIDSGNFFNSVLIPAQIIAEVGVPDQELFIWGDELDYLYRILRHGFHVVTVLNSIHRHPALKVNFCAWKQYYMVRNIVVLLKRHRQTRYMIVPLRSLIKILLSYALRGKNIRLILRGLLDGLTNRLGKTVPPGFRMPQ